MYKNLQNRFRQDLVITQTVNKETLSKCYVVKDPNSGETFEFGEEEYFLCQAMNGISTLPQILVAFESRFAIALTEKDFQDFYKQIKEFRLLEASYEPNIFNIPMLSNATSKGGIGLANTSPIKCPKKDKRNKLFSLSNPDAFFTFLASIFKPFKSVFLGFVWLLLPLIILAILTISHHKTLLQHDVASLVKPVSWLVWHILNMFMINLTSKLAQGVVWNSFGGNVGQFGVKLTFGFLPRFYLKKQDIWQLGRNIQLWVFGTPIMVRLFLFSLGVLTWYCTIGTETGLKGWALSLGYMGFVDFLIDGSPFWPSDGYGLIIAYLRLPPTLLKKNLLVWDMMLSRRTLPKRLTILEKLKLQAFALSVVFAWAYLAFILVEDISHRLQRSIPPGILGQGTMIFLLSVPFVLGFRAWWSLINPKQGRGNAPNKKEAQAEERFLSGRTEWLHKTLNFLQKHGRKVLIMGGCAIILSLPYPYRPGGAIELLPPKQQQIQAPVEGKLTKVFFPGGDGGWLKAGTVIANLEAVDLENTVLTSQEQVKQQQADLAKAQAVLSKLLAMPKPEDVAVAQQQVNVAQQQVNVAQQQVNVAQQELQNAKVKAQFSARQAARYKDLYSTGAFSLQQYENAQKEAQSDRTTVAQQQQSVAVAQQDVETNKQKAKQAQANKKLVMSGPYPQDIEAARQEVAAARANLKRLEQLLKYNQDQFRRTALVMPIDGYLITPYLQQKVGSFLKLGETFAVAEDNRHIQGQVQVPEYDVGEFSVGAQAEVKLIAYAGKPLLGKVVAIEPTTITDSAFEVSAKAEDEDTSRDEPRFVRVVVDLPNTQNVLKARMSGYAKLEGRTMPVLLAFTRSLVRFVEIELWSWLP
jgi:multidrug resistance efflux pump